MMLLGFYSVFWLVLLLGVLHGQIIDASHGAGPKLDLIDPHFKVQGRFDIEGVANITISPRLGKITCGVPVALTADILMTSGLMVEDHHQLEPFTVQWICNMSAHPICDVTGRHALEATFKQLSCNSRFQPRVEILDQGNLVYHIASKPGRVTKGDPCELELICHDECGEALEPGAILELEVIVNTSVPLMYGVGVYNNDTGDAINLFFRTRAKFTYDIGDESVYVANYKLIVMTKPAAMNMSCSAEYHFSIKKTLKVGFVTAPVPTKWGVESLYVKCLVCVTLVPCCVFGNMLVKDSSCKMIWDCELPECHKPSAMLYLAHLPCDKHVAVTVRAARGDEEVANTLTIFVGGNGTQAGPQPMGADPEYEDNDDTSNHVGGEPSPAGSRMLLWKAMDDNYDVIKSNFEQGDEPDSAVLAEE